MHPRVMEHSDLPYGITMKYFIRNMGVSLTVMVVLLQINCEYLLYFCYNNVSSCPPSIAIITSFSTGIMSTSRLHKP